MKITIITGPFGYIPPNGIGAVEKLWYDLALEFKKKGCHVTIISKLPVEYESAKVDIERLYVKGYKRRKTIYEDLFLDFIYSMKCLFKVCKTDVLVLNTFWAPLLCRLIRSKYKVAVYNVARYPKRQFKFYRNIDAFFCVSNAIEKELTRQLPGRINKIKMVNNPINAEIFTWKEKRSVPPIVIMYHGRIHPEKGLDILVSAFKQLQLKYKNLELALVGAKDIANGGGGPKYVDKLNSIVGGNIKWIDSISEPSKLANTLATCDIYCYPSVAEKGETFGVAPLEAMGIGRPVIVSSLECFTDFIEDGVNGFVFNHRSSSAIDELATCMERLVKDPELREKMGRKAFESSRIFSNENIADQYLSEFGQLLNNYE